MKAQEKQTNNKVFNAIFKTFKLISFNIFNNTLL